MNLDQGCEGGWGHHPYFRHSCSVHTHLWMWPSFWSHLHTNRHDLTACNYRRELCLWTLCCTQNAVGGGWWTTEQNRSGAAPQRTCDQWNSLGKCVICQTLRAGLWGFKRTINQKQIYFIWRIFQTNKKCHVSKLHQHSVVKNTHCGEVKLPLVWPLVWLFLSTAGAKCQNSSLHVVAKWEHNGRRDRVSCVGC